MYDNFPIVFNSQFQFDINELDERGWSVKDSRTNFMSTKKIVDHWLEKFVSYVVSERGNNSNEKIS
jgi:hypothetical protein